MLQEYKFNMLTYTPSIFGKRVLIFTEREHVRVYKTEAEWLAGIERLVRDETRQNAVLLFFKNKRFLEKYPAFYDYYALTEDTDQEVLEGYVKAATVKGKLTLLTREYGRGIDFPMPEENEVVVIQTFLSSLKSEQRHIMGRTARQGKKGKYHMCLCFEHLMQKMDFDEYAHWPVFEAGSGYQIKRLLEEKQMTKSNKKLDGIFFRRNPPRHREAETAAWEKLLFHPHGSSNQKLGKLAEFSTAKDTLYLAP
eukprot:Skav233185  [mRNA]  locus=scaffold24:234748:235503:- [translate_table: standard]